jgi:hypothetical protein
MRGLDSLAVVFDEEGLAVGDGGFDADGARRCSARPPTALATRLMRIWRSSWARCHRDEGIVVALDGFRGPRSDAGRDKHGFAGSARSTATGRPALRAKVRVRRVMLEAVSSRSASARWRAGGAAEGVVLVDDRRRLVTDSRGLLTPWAMVEARRTAASFGLQKGGFDGLAASDVEGNSAPEVGEPAIWVPRASSQCTSPSGQTTRN